LGNDNTSAHRLMRGLVSTSGRIRLQNSVGSDPAPQRGTLPMDVARTILMRMFGRPQGMLGKLGGTVMARMNRPAAAWGIGLLELRPGEKVLEIGFGPGVAIELLARGAPDIQVAGIDPSSEMVGQAANAAAIARHAVDLRRGSADDLPFDGDSFDAALAINSLQVWPDAMAGLREIRRVTKPGPCCSFSPAATVRPIPCLPRPGAASERRRSAGRGCRRSAISCTSTSPSATSIRAPPGPRPKLSSNDAASAATLPTWRRRSAAA
jgi:hypothetical protein